MHEKTQNGLLLLLLIYLQRPALTNIETYLSHILVSSASFTSADHWIIQNNTNTITPTNNSRINQQPDLHVRLDGRANPTFRP